jgi:hypothetical protein
MTEFESADAPPELGPIFRAGRDGECSEGDHIQEGENIRADGLGGWVHADGKCDGTDFL